ncbi:glycosyltransferase [Candidatus Dependentiae bacterium]|nr:glycosyltransferase [Candidatus Dependentiae bacterium]
MIVTKFPYSLQTFIINQIEGLIERGHDLYILAEKNVDKKLPPQLMKYNFSGKVFFGNIPSGYKQFDIIYGQLASHGKRCLKLKQECGLNAKLVVSFRGYATTVFLKKNPHIYDDVFQQVDLCLPVCDYLKEYLISYGCPIEKITVMPSAINCDQFVPYKKSFGSKRKIKIITVARLVEQKGLIYSIDAVARLTKEHPNVEYIIVGDGKLKKLLEKQIKMLGMQGTIHLIGEKSHLEVGALLQSSDIFLLAPITSQNYAQEGIPNALKEAMACQLPVVSTFHAGIPEVVEHGISGFLVTEQNVFGLVDRLSYLISHPELWHIMGKAGREKILATYEKEMLNDKLEQIFLDLCSHII